MKSFLKPGIWLVSLALLILANCTNPTGPETGNPTPEVPRNVKAEFVNNRIQVTWEQSGTVDGYKVYRRVGVDAFVLVSPTNTLINSKDFPDADPAILDKNVQYAVASVLGTNMSILSPPSNYISNFVQNIKATRLQYNNKIVVSWRTHADAEAYLVYRYINKLDINPVFIGETTTLSLEDTKQNSAIVEDTPYFYRVSWKKQGTEYGSSGPFTQGVFGTTVDYYEDNDDRLSNKAVTDPSAKIFSFCFNDGKGGMEADVDWYVLPLPDLNNSPCVTVNLPETGLLNNGELKFEFFYNSTTYITQDIGKGDNYFYFNSENFVTGITDLYYKIYCVPAVNRDVIQSYTINIF